MKKFSLIKLLFQVIFKNNINAKVATMTTNKPNLAVNCEETPVILWYSRTILRLDLAKSDNDIIRTFSNDPNIFEQILRKMKSWDQCHENNELESTSTLEFEIFNCSPSQKRGRTG